MAASSESLSAMILAGGYSRRMGTDKALLELPEGRTLLERTVEVARELTSDVVIVTPWPERYTAVLGSTVRFITEDPALQRGPLGGLAHGLQQVRSDWCLVLACDLPQLESRALHDWWKWLQASALSAQTQTAIASLVRCETSAFKQQASQKSNKQWETLCGFYRQSCLTSLRRYLDTASGAGDSTHLSIQKWLESLSILAYSDLPQSNLFNCNTAEDWAKFCA